jgi:hypothetical protein
MFEAYSLRRLVVRLVLGSGVSGGVVVRLVLRYFPVTSASRDSVLGNELRNIHRVSPGWNTFPSDSVLTLYSYTYWESRLYGFGPPSLHKKKNKKM